MSEAEFNGSKKTYILQFFCPLFSNIRSKQQDLINLTTKHNRAKNEACARHLPVWNFSGSSAMNKWALATTAAFLMSERV